MGRGPASIGQRQHMHTANLHLQGVQLLRATVSGLVPRGSESADDDGLYGRRIIESNRSCRIGPDAEPEGPHTAKSDERKRYVRVRPAKTITGVVAGISSGRFTSSEH